jgi:hypothetical protein
MSSDGAPSAPGPAGPQARSAVSGTDRKGRFRRNCRIVVGLALAVALAATVRFAAQHLARRRIETNESAPIRSVRAYLGAQNSFKREDHYGIGLLVYANPQHGTGFPDLYQIGYGTEDAGKVLGSVLASFARATPGGVPKDGYYFTDLVGYDRQAIDDLVRSGGYPSADWEPFDHTIDCGLSATPASYGVTGRNIFIIDVTGTVCQRDAKRLYPDLEDGDAVPPVRTYPNDGRPTEWIPQALTD